MRPRWPRGLSTIVGDMAKTWVLRTETKGTGAHVVPLEQASERASPVEPVLVPRAPARTEPAPEAPVPRIPRRFRIVDVLTRQTLVEDASAREAVEALKRVRSIVDADVYVWQEERERWRLLSLGEQQALWEITRSQAELSPKPTD
jgi:hypothetical protein